MFDSLTKREKFLVYVLMIVVIGVLFQYLLLMPALNKNSELESQLSELSSQNQLMQMAIDNSALTTTNLAKAQASLAEAKQSFTAFMHNEEIDRLLCGMARANGLKVASLSINNLTKENDTDTEAAIAAETHLKVIQVSLAFTGDKEAFWRFLDDVQNTSYLVLQNAAVSNTGKGTFYYAELQLYMPAQ